MPTAVWRMDGHDRVSDLWCNGWHVAFPLDGDKPAAQREAPPLDAIPVDTALLEHAGDQLNIAANNWVIGFGDGAPLLLPARPKHNDESVVLRLRKIHGSRARRRRADP